MIDAFGMNEWTVSGEVFYLRELKGEFAASVKVRGVSRREDALSSQVLEFPFLMQSKIYEEAKKKGLKMYRKVTLSGHFESWQQGSTGRDLRRVMFIADYVIDVK